jgi:hypothetical protein
MHEKEISTWLNECHGSQGKTEELFQIAEIYRDMTTQCKVDPGLDSFAINDIPGTIGGSNGVQGAGDCNMSGLMA